MTKFDQFLGEVKKGVKNLVLELVHDYQDKAIKESEDFLERTKSDLERWLKLLIAGELTREEFEWLVKGKKDLLALHTLKQEGLARVQIDRFRNGLLKLIVDKAFAILI